MRLFRAVAATAVTLAVCLPLVPVSAEPGAYRLDDYGRVLNVVPPGSDGSLTALEILQAGTDLRADHGADAPPNFADQLEMYDRLGRAPGSVTEENIGEFYKDASFGVAPGTERSRKTPKAGVTIVRDSWGVPHVYGTTYENVAWGAGYAGTEDRMFLMDVLRHVGAARMSEFLGASPANVEMDRAQLLVAGYTTEEATRQIDELSDRFGAEGERFESAVDAFVAGVNAAQLDAVRTGTLPGEYLALQQVPRDWTRADVVYVASLVGGIFGRGGGGEYANAQWLRKLQDRFGAAEGRAVFDDLRAREDGEAPTTIDRRFPYPARGAVDDAAVAMPDPGAPVAPGTGGTVEAIPPLGGAPASLPAFPEYADAPWGRIPLPFGEQSASNALLVSAKESATGHPIAVFGPQTGYFAPQLLTEIDLHGPGYDARGVAFAGTHLVVQLGRGRDYAWSATSASGDNVDQVFDVLCNPDGSPATVESTHYLYRGECVPMVSRVHQQVAKPSAGGPGPAVVVRMPLLRTVHGNVVLRTVAEGRPVAVVNQRSTFLREIDSGIGFMRVNDPAYVDSAEDFQRAFDGVDYTFNWFYADDRDIAYLHSGRLPVRAPGVDPDLPTWGTGEYDWQGFLGFEDKPKDVNPSRGYLVSWNNKPAPGWNAADDNWSYGSVYRSLNLSRRIDGVIAGAGRASVTDVVNVVADAAHADTRAAELLPELLAVVGDDPASAQVRGLLSAWLAAGALREDRDRDGAYSHQQAIALFDAWYPLAAKAVLRGALGDLTDALPQGLDDHPRHGVGSAWNGIAWYGYVDKELRTLLGEDVRDAWSRSYCGGGTLAGCAEALRASLADAVAAVTAAQGADPGAWTYDKSTDFIRSTTVGVVGVRPIDWQNRPTFQQVVDFRDHRPRDGAEAVGVVEVQVSAVDRPIVPPGAR